MSSVGNSLGIEKIVVGNVERRDQRLDLAPQRGVVSAAGVEERGAIVRVDVGQREKNRLAPAGSVTAPVRRRLASGPSARYSQARANAHSFFTVAGDRSSARRGFFDAQAGEVPQRHDLRFARVGLLEARQRFVDGDEIGERRIDAHHRAVQIDAFGAAAMFDALIMAGALDENAAHRERGGGEEMPAAVPAPLLPIAGDAEIRLVNERRRLQRLIRLPLARETGPREFAQFVIDFRQHLAAKCRDRHPGWCPADIRNANYDTGSDRAIKSSYAGVTANRASWRRASTTSCSPSRRICGRCFLTDLTSLQGHFEAALALVVRNLDDMNALREPLRDLGAQHVHWGARPEDYVTAREALDRRHRRACRRPGTPRSSNTGATPSRRSSFRCWKARRCIRRWPPSIWPPRCPTWSADGDAAHCLSSRHHRRRTRRQDGSSADDLRGDGVHAGRNVHRQRQRHLRVALIGRRGAGKANRTRSEKGPRLRRRDVHPIVPGGVRDCGSGSV